MKTTKLQLKGLSCQHCINALTKEFAKNNAIQSVHVELDKAEIVHEQTLSLDEIISIVKDAGYEASE